MKIFNLDVKQNFLSIIEWEFIFWLILQNCYGFSRFYHSDYRLNIYRSSTKLQYCFQPCLSVCLLTGWVLMDLFKLVHLRTPPALALLPIWTPPGHIGPAPDGHVQTCSHGDHPPGHVQTCSPCSPYTCRPVGSWHSTEMPCLLFHIYHPQRRCSKVMFLHLTVSLSVHRGVCLKACWDIPPRQVHPQVGIPPGQVHPPRQVHPTPLAGTPQSRYTPLAGTPQGRYTPLQWSLQWTVHILLECFLVVMVHFHCPTPIPIPIPTPIPMK